MRRANSDLLHRDHSSWCNDCNKQCKAKDCWNNTKTLLRDHWPNEGYAFTHLDECLCDGHTYDNRTTWDYKRTSHCRSERENLEKKFPFPKVTGA